MCVVFVIDEGEEGGGEVSHSESIRLSSPQSTPSSSHPRLDTSTLRVIDTLSRGNEPGQCPHWDLCVQSGHTER